MDGERGPEHQCQWAALSASLPDQGLDLPESLAAEASLCPELTGDIPPSGRQRKYFHSCLGSGTASSRTGEEAERGKYWVSSSGCVVMTDWGPYLCFLMPLESASPPPQSFPSDILCFLLFTGASFSSKARAVTASRHVSDPSDSDPVAEQAHDECPEPGCKASLTMDISLNASGCEQPILSSLNPSANTSSGISEKPLSLWLTWIYVTDAHLYKVTVKLILYT